MDDNLKNAYDLDGTISKLNNTFDFIFEFYKYKDLKIKSFLFRFIKIFLEKIPLTPYYLRRRLLINLLFYNLNKEDLEKFFNNRYRELFLKNLTILGKKIIKKEQSNAILLTGCTEIPANNISNLFKFKRTISTEFSFKNNLIKRIKRDTYGGFKKKFVSKTNSKRMTYYTDDRKEIKSLKDNFKEIIIVKKNG